MKLYSIIKELSTWPVPDWIQDAESETQKLTTLKDDKLKWLAKRFKLPRLDTYIRAAARKSKCKTLDKRGVIQLLILFELFMEQFNSVKLGECDNICTFKLFYWICILSVIGSILIILYIMSKDYPNTCLLRAALLFQYISIIAWSTLLVFGATIAFSSDTEVTDSERYYVKFTGVYYILAVIVFVHNAIMLIKVGEFYARIKIRVFEKYYGDIRFFADPEIEEAIREIVESKNSCRYDIM